MNYFKKNVATKTDIPATIKKLGFPIWNKISHIKDKNGNSNLLEDSSEILLIPFVRENEEYVNASLIIKTLGNDTSYSFKCDWQYKELVNTLTNKKREKYALLFMYLNKSVFNYDEFKITDSTLFAFNGYTKPELTLRLQTFEYCAEFSVSFLNCPQNYTNCPYQEHWLTIIFTYCWEEDDWIPDGGGGNSGSSSGGVITISNGNSGGSNSNGQNSGWIPIQTIENSQQSPCEVAKNIARQLDTFYEQSRVDSILSTIQGLSTSTVENGFPVFRKYLVNSQNVTDTTFTNYSNGTIHQGTDSNLTYTFTIPSHSVLYFKVHSHPPHRYSAPSVGDLFSLIDARQNEYHYQASIIRAANGNTYALFISDLHSASYFKSAYFQYLESTHWKSESAIGIAFQKAFVYFQEKYKNYLPDGDNKAYEMAFASVLNEFSSGVTLAKIDSNGKFAPIIVTTSTDPRKPKRKIYSIDCQ
ncbi:MAG TPA: hypothetical protein PKN96_11840 [Flavobacterium sp.]|uniref:hypothetical protein n=1 Tax=Flavobacterium sp. TaxID=239 RepID=UPI002C34AFA2|nr:hypothetical protein [Flavobacterium sp.]HNP33974.1 hypothetical protein [Flavobacterium sp.]